MVQTIINPPFIRQFVLLQPVLLGARRHGSTPVLLDVLRQVLEAHVTGGDDAEDTDQQRQVAWQEACRWLRTGQLEYHAHDGFVNLLHDNPEAVAVLPPIYVPSSVGIHSITSREEDIAEMRQQLTRLFDQALEELSPHFTDARGARWAGNFTPSPVDPAKRWIERVDHRPTVCDPQGSVAIRTYWEHWLVPASRAPGAEELGSGVLDPGAKTTWNFTSGGEPTILYSSDPATWAEFLADLEGDHQGQLTSTFPSPLLVKAIDEWRAKGAPPVERFSKKITMKLENSPRHPRSRFHIHEIEETILSISIIARVAVVIHPSTRPPFEVPLDAFAAPMRDAGFAAPAIARMQLEAKQQEQYRDYARRTVVIPASVLPNTRRYFDWLLPPTRPEGQWDAILRERAPDIMGVVFSITPRSTKIGEPALYFTPET